MRVIKRKAGPPASRKSIRLAARLAWRNGSAVAPRLCVAAFRQLCSEQLSVLEPRACLRLRCGHVAARRAPHSSLHLLSRCEATLTQPHLDERRGNVSRAYDAICGIHRTLQAPSRVSKGPTWGTALEERDVCREADVLQPTGEAMTLIQALMIQALMLQPLETSRASPARRRRYGDRIGACRCTMISPINPSAIACTPSTTSKTPRSRMGRFASPCPPSR